MKYFVAKTDDFEEFDTEEEAISHIADELDDFDREYITIFYGEQKKFVPPSSKGSLTNA